MLILNSGPHVIYFWHCDCQGILSAYLVAQIRRMDLEARSLPPTQKATLLAKLREYKSDLNNLKREFKKVSSAQDPVASRNELMESGMADHVMVCNKTLELPAFLLRHY